MSATLTKVEVPDIGDFDDVPVIEILVSVGDSVAVEDPLVTLESDKATMDVPAPLAGVVREISVSVGDRVAQGSVLMSVESADGGSSGSGDGDAGGSEPAEQAAAVGAASAPTTTPAESVEAPSQPAEGPAQPEAPGPSQPAQAPAHPQAPAPARTNGGGPIYASPSARRLARELGVDLRSVSGSGRKGRITKEDVQSLADGKGTAGAPGSPAPGGGGGGGVAGLDLLPWPQVDFEKFGPIERVERSRIQRISAPNLARNWVMIPHVTHNDEADITDLEAWRKRLNEEHAREGVKFTMVSFLV
ncbi:MAG TPA: biotin/lipoyl-containing protein, partial [Solirubrobacteraceae bacterium]